MAEIEDSQDNVDSPVSNHDFLDSGPPLPEELLAKMQKLVDVADGDPKEVLQKLIKQKLGTLQEPVGPVQQLLSSDIFVLLALLLLIASFFGKKFVLVLNISSSIHDTYFCFL
jgi:hypothetical protein